MSAGGRFPSADPRYDGRAVVVTGAARPGQVGEVVARAFAERGAVVECIDRNVGVHDRARELAEAGFQAFGHQVELTEPHALSSVVATIAARHAGQVAAVASLAGGFAASGPLEESDPAVFAHQLDANLASAYHTARAFLPLVRAGRGAFVFVSAASVLPGGRVSGIAAYAMAKGGLLQLVRAIAQEGAAYGVRANALAPTALRTDANVGAMGELVHYVEREELAMMAVILCAPAFSRVTGQVLELA